MTEFCLVFYYLFLVLTKYNYIWTTNTAIDNIIYNRDWNHGYRYYKKNSIYIRAIGRQGIYLFCGQGTIVSISVIGTPKLIVIPQNSQ